jgi:cyclophilin family peptidyl-prolyl cis-trans isomerase
VEVDLSKADKRARKKAVRDERIARAVAAQRRKRLAMLGGILVLLAALVGLALFTGEEEDDGGCWSDEARTGGKSYNEPPQMTIEDGTDYSAVVSTSEGDFTMDLLEDETPTTVNNFVCLARDGFYDGIIWHRVEKDRVIQTGDPQGTGAGGPGYEIPDELPEGGENPYTWGAVGMATAGPNIPNTGGSQFFVVVKDPDPKGGFDPADFPPTYTVFGRVDPEDEASTETLLAISNVDVQGGGGPTSTMPVRQVVIESIDIEES